MFQKRRQRTAAAAAPVRHPPSIVSADMSIVGDLETAGEVHVDGAVEGNVKAARVTVGRDGKIGGRIETEALEVHGAVVGTVQADDVILFSTARMQGDVFHGRLRVEAGAVVHGMYRRLEGVQAALAHDEPTLVGPARDAAEAVPTGAAAGEPSRVFAPPKPLRAADLTGR